MLSDPDRPILTLYKLDYEVDSCVHWSITQVLNSSVNGINILSTILLSTSILGHSAKTKFCFQRTSRAPQFMK